MAEQSSDPWRLAWRSATSDTLLVALLLAIAGSLALTAWIPQRPSSEIAYARWLSAMQVQFGGLTSAMRALGLFSVVTSAPFRAILALLSGSLILRLVERVDRLRMRKEIAEPPENWGHVCDGHLVTAVEALRSRGYRVRGQSSVYQADRWPWSGVFPSLAHLGALVLLIGLLLWQLLGWQVEGIVLQKGEKQILPGTNRWVELHDSGRATDHSLGLTTYIQARGPGIEVSASEQGDEPLELLISPDAEPGTKLRIPLTEDSYFAVPDAELIVRISPRSEDPYARADIQTYSSPSGEIISERITEKGGQAAFTVGGVSFTFLAAPYARVAAIRNPGWIVTALGLVTLMIGTIGGLLWPERRFWLRQEGGPIESVGSVPTWLFTEEVKQ